MSKCRSALKRNTSDCPSQTVRVGVMYQRRRHIPSLSLSLRGVFNPPASCSCSCRRTGRGTESVKWKKCWKTSSSGQDLYTKCFTIRRLFTRKAWHLNFTLIMHLYSFQKETGFTLLCMLKYRLSITWRLSTRYQSSYCKNMINYHWFSLPVVLLDKRCC